MPWKQQLIDKATDVLRFTLKVCGFIDLLLLSLFSVWFCVKFIWFSVVFLDRVLFDSPW